MKISILSTRIKLKNWYGITCHPVNFYWIKEFESVRHRRCYIHNGTTVFEWHIPQENLQSSVASESILELNGESMMNSEGPLKYRAHAVLLELQRGASTRPALMEISHLKNDKEYSAIKWILERESSRNKVLTTSRLASLEDYAPQTIVSRGSE